MLLNLSIGDTSFELVMSSSANLMDSSSSFSVNYVTKEGNEKDTIVQLGNFNGTLRIFQKKLHTNSNPSQNNVLQYTADSEHNDDESLSEKMTSLESNQEQNLENFGKKVSFHSKFQKPPFVHENSITESNGQNRNYSQIMSDTNTINFRNPFLSMNRRSVESSLSNSVNIEESQLNNVFQKNHSFRNFASNNSSNSSSDYSLDSELSLTHSSLDRYLNEISSVKGNFRHANRLHFLCRGEKSKVKEMLKLLRLNPGYASSQDENGKYPLHIIAENEVLFNKKKVAIQAFVEKLIKAYPEAVLAKDDEDRIPFTSTIEAWTRKYNTSDKLDKIRRSFFNANADNAVIPLNVVVTPIILWSFKMLSKIMHHKNKLADLTPERYEASLTPREKILDDFCSIPNLLKTILVIDDEIDRNAILEMPIVRCSLLNTELVNEWIVMLLRSERMHSRAIDYFEFISNISINAALHLKVKPKEEDIKKFMLMRENMFHHVSQLKGLIPAFYFLKSNDLRRACSSDAVQRVLDNMMMESKVICALLLNCSSNLLMIISLHEHLQVYLIRQNSEGLSILTNSPWPLLLWLCTYFFFYGEVLAYQMAGSFKKYLHKFHHFWNIIESLAVALTTLVVLFTLLSRSPPHYSPLFIITKIFLWLRFFSFLRGVNMHLATFVLALSNSLYNLRWFLFVLFLSCTMFADILRYSFQFNTTFCEGVTSATDFTISGDYCSENLTRAFIRVFAIIVGDIELDTYRESAIITGLWLLLSIFGIIVLLNVLIAIVTSSYEESFVGRYHLFGTARLPVLAKHEFLNYTLTKRHEIGNRCLGHMTYFALESIMALSFFLFLGQANYVLMFLQTHDLRARVFQSSFFLIASLIALTAIIMIFFDVTHFYCVSVKDNHSSIQAKLRTGIDTISQALAHFVLGITKKNISDPEADKRKMTDGLINFVVLQTEENIANSEYRILSELYDLEGRLEEQGIIKKKE